MATLSDLELIHSTAPVGLCLLDLDMRFVAINARLAAINGVSVAEHIGRRPRDVRTRLGEHAEPILRHVMKTGVAIDNLEVDGPDPLDPSSTRHWLCSYHPARDAAGTVIGTVCTVLDVTSLKESEAERCAAEAEAAAHGGAAGDADTRRVIHDLANMLGVVVGEVEVLSDTPGLDAKIVPAVARLERATTRAIALLEELQRIRRAAAAPPAAPASDVVRTVLVVDDDALMRETAVMMVTALGHTALVAGSAAEALAHVDAGARPDILFSDVTMPDMDGLALAAAIKTRQPDIGIILTSGDGDNEPEHTLPGSLRLRKPYKKADLGAKITEILAR